MTLKLLFLLAGYQGVTTKMPKTFKLNKKELNLLILCCIIITTVLSYVIIIEPFLKRYKSIRGEIQARQVKLLKLKRTLLLKEPVELSYLEILPRLSQAGSDEEKYALFLKEVELTSRRNNIYITTLKPISVKKDNNKTKEYIIKVEAEGRLDSLAKFLYALPESGLLLSLEQLQISYLSQQEEMLKFQMNLGRMVIDTNNEN